MCRACDEASICYYFDLLILKILVMVLPIIKFVTKLYLKNNSQSRNQNDFLIYHTLYNVL